jgi:hypothetical protein
MLEIRKASVKSRTGVTGLDDEFIEPAVVADSRPPCGRLLLSRKPSWSIEAKTVVQYCWEAMT